jgi:AraC-like DNA-binding protein
MTFSRLPIAALKPFVELIWACEAVAPKPAPARELVLPTGALHLVVRLDDAPLRVFRDTADTDGLSLRHAVIGGARTAPYVKDIARPVPTIGALLRPGAAGLLVGAPASVFTGAHCALADLWGAAPVERLRDRLAATASPARRLAILEAALLARLPRPVRLDPRIAHALARIPQGAPVAAVAADCGLSHRHFTARFHEAVGLTPKAWARVHRFGRALDRLAAEPAIAWADLAVAEGYADQAHFTREFRALAGLTPGTWRRRAPVLPRHVLL